MRTMAKPIIRAAFFCIVSACAGFTHAGGGPLGIDHVVPMDNKGIWKRGVQDAVLGSVVLVNIGAALWEGGESRIGHSLWQSVDSMLISTVAANGGKLIFTRARPSQTDDPNQWFKGGHHYSFPSGEVAAASGIITPFVLEYGKDNPAVWAL